MNQRALVGCGRERFDSAQIVECSLGAGARALGAAECLQEMPRPTSRALLRHSFGPMTKQAGHSCWRARLHAKKTVWFGRSFSRTEQNLSINVTTKVVDISVCESFLAVPDCGLVVLAPQAFATAVE